MKAFIIVAIIILGIIGYFAYGFGLVKDVFVDTSTKASVYIVCMEENMKEFSKNIDGVYAGYLQAKVKEFIRDCAEQAGLSEEEVKALSRQLRGY